MISHALTIVANEMQRHFDDVYPTLSPGVVTLGNIAEGIASTAGSTGVARDMLVITLVNINEEKALKNLPNTVRNDATLRVSYENPPYFLNLTILLTATHSVYSNALLVMSRALRFFQANHVFTPDSVAPSSMTTGAPANILDQLESFKLIFDLYSPSMEEANHLWGTLGGKQYPFAMFNLRLLDLKFRSVQAEAGVITSVVHDFAHHRNGAV